MRKRASNRMVSESVSSLPEPFDPVDEPPFVEPQELRVLGEIHRVRIYQNGWLEAFGADQHQLRKYAGVARTAWPAARDNLAPGAEVLVLKFMVPKPITDAQRAALDRGEAGWREAR